MVLESLFDTKSILRYPLIMFLLGIFLSGTAILTSHLLFPSAASILGIAFITIGATPLIHSVYVKEEAKEVESVGEKGTFLERHVSLIKIYSWFFIGLVLSYAFWFVVLPQQEINLCLGERCITTPHKDEIFKEQTKTLENISALRSKITGQITGNLACTEDFFCIFNLIFENNAYVLLLAVIFSFIYGAGALFLISWNASIIGVLVGQSIIMQEHFKFFGLLPHGIPELMGYFFGAIAGGILSVAITRKRHLPKEFRIVIKDVMLLMLLAFFSLFIGSVVEAYLVIGDELTGLTIGMFYVILLMVLVVGHGARHYREK